MFLYFKMDILSFRCFKTLMEHICTLQEKGLNQQEKHEIIRYTEKKYFDRKSTLFCLSGAILRPTFRQFETPCTFN